MARKAKVDVNKADRDELAAVPGIGRSTAEAMVELRFERGGFKRLDELAEVPGIGEQTLQGLRKHVSLTTNGKRRATPAAKPAAGDEKAARKAEQGVEAARRGANETVASATKVAEAGADVGRETAAAGAEARAGAAETAKTAQGAAKEQIESARAGRQEAAQAAMSSGNVLIESAREASQTWLGFVQDQIWANVQTAQMLARCRSPQDVLEVQRTYVRSSMERLAEEQARFASLATRMATRSIRPAR